MTNTAPFVPGQRVRFTGDRNPGGYGPYEIGQIVTVKNIYGDPQAGGGYTVDLVGDDEGTDGWGSIWFESVPVGTLEEFNRYPNGTVFRDRDGWVHTKVRDAVQSPVVPGTNSGKDTTTYVDDRGGTGTFGSPWQWGPLEILSVPEVDDEEFDYSFGYDEAPKRPSDDEAPTRPLIDFSGASRATAREYARDLQSRVNKPETNAVLKQVATAGKGGAPVDAYALAEALLDAMRHISTRFGQSMVRRREGEKAAHLGYIVHAVLANHADNLPAYPEGERSRVAFESRQQVADLEAEVRILRERAEEQEERGDAYAEQVEALSAEREQVKVALKEARKEVEALTEALRDQQEIAKLHEETATEAFEGWADVRKRLQTAEAERDAAAATVGYIVENFEDNSQRERVYGYWDGVKDALLPSTEG